MKVLGVLPFARLLLDQAVEKGDVVIDATAGNGHDTVYLAKLVGDQGTVFSFDIQETAINSTKKRIEEHHCHSQVLLFQRGHEEAKTLIPTEKHGQIAGAVFNLGYLPGGDKAIVTKPETTITAINDIFSMLKKEGIIVLVVYPGHEEGKNERDQLVSFGSSFDQQEAHVLTYQFINQKNNPPFIIAIEKK